MISPVVGAIVISVIAGPIAGLIIGLVAASFVNARGNLWQKSAANQKSSREGSQSAEPGAAADRPRDTR